jgi:hypothetical protein
MVEAARVRVLATALPRASDASEGERLVFEVAGKGFAWTWNERIHPKKPRRPRPDVLAIRCPMERKEMLLAAEPETFFDEDHYRGYPAILARLDVIDEDELAGLLTGAWRLMAPKSLL